MLLLKNSSWQHHLSLVLVGPGLHVSGSLASIPPPNQEKKNFSYCLVLIYGYLILLFFYTDDLKAPLICFILDKANRLNVGNAVNPLPKEEDKKLVVVKSPNAVNPLVWDYFVSNYVFLNF